MNTNEKITALAEAEEARLITEAQGGNERAMERLLDAYAPLIEKNARDHSHGENYEDALQEARVAFLTIVHSHDLARGSRLYTYAGTRIGHEMKDALSASENPWGIPVRTMQRFYQIKTAADGDVAAGADMASAYGMDPLTFVSIADMMAVGSIEYAVETEESGTTILDTFGGPTLGGGAVEDAYEALIDRMTVADIMADAEDATSLRIVGKAYGFEGDLDTGESEPSPVLSSTVSLAAHSDATVAANLSWEDSNKWSRAKVQRVRTKQITVWREKYAESDVSGKES